MSEEINDMFSRIAGRYDLLNDLLSFGIHRLWKKKTVKMSEIKPGSRVLDCASGTGDLAIEFKKMSGIKGFVLATDFNPEMLSYAEKKFKKKNYKIDIEVADVLNLRFEDNSFDIASIGFGIRNVDSVQRCLEEMARVVKSGGKVLVLEFGQPQGLFSLFYNFYSRYIIPIIGKLIDGNSFAYKYLHESSAKFPCREHFTQIMESTGNFTSIRYYPLTFGIAYLYIGKVR